MPTFESLHIDHDGREVEITSVKNIKYLGIVVDSPLRWDAHINNLIKKLRGLVGKFKYLINVFDSRHLKTVYYALIKSQLTYGIIAWGGAMNCYTKGLEIIQKLFIKIMYKKSYRYPSNNLYSETKLLDFRQLFCQNILMHLFKNKNTIPNKDHKYGTRHKQNSLQQPHAVKTIGQRSHYYLAPRIYNELPIELRRLNS